MLASHPLVDLTRKTHVAELPGICSAALRKRNSFALRGSMQLAGRCRSEHRQDSGGVELLPIFMGLRFDMNDNVGHMKTAVEQPVLHAMRDVMAFTDRALASHADMNVRKSHEAALAYAAFFRARDARHLANSHQNFRNQFRSGLSIQDLADRLLSIPIPLKMITPHERTAAQSSACAQEVPPINAAEIPTAAARDVIASERCCHASV